MRKYFYTLIVYLLLSNMLWSQWSQVGFPNKWITALFVKDNDILAGSGENIYMSNDNGESWDTIAVLNTFEVFDFESIDETLFAVTSWICLDFCPPAPCIYRSQNDGITWDSVFVGVSGASSIVKSNGYIFSDVDGYLYRSEDSGTSWTPITPDSIFSGVGGPLASNEGVLYVSAYHRGLYRTSDNGITWTLINIGLENSIVYSMVINDSTLFVGTGGTGYGVYRSNNNGLNWVSINIGLPNNSIVSSLTLSGHNLIAAIGDSIYLTMNSGENWINVSAGLNLEGYGYVNTLVVMGEYLLAGTNDGIWRRLLSDIVSVDKSDNNNLPMVFRLEGNYPNPFNSGTTIRYSLPRAELVSLKVYDILGQEIAVLINERKLAGKQKFNFSANGLPSGIYFYELQAGGFVETNKMLFLK